MAEVHSWSDGTPAFGRRGDQFTAEQIAAIERLEGSLILSANAGSGKTAVLVERFVRATRTLGTDPRRILAITFTEKAAGELKKRLRERFAELGDRTNARLAESAQVSTIHGFCSRLLRAHPLRAGIDPAYVVLDEVDSRVLRADAYDVAMGRWLDEAAQAGELEMAAAYRAERLPDLLAALYDRLRSAGQAAPRLPDVSRRAAETELDARAITHVQMLDGLLRCFGEEYSRMKDARGALDYSDLELRALALLSDHGDVLVAEKGRYDLLMVDEFQDTNAVQMRLICKIDRDNLFTVGDEFQSIYGFRHADVRIFRNRREELAERGAALELAISFRSRRAIVDAVNAAFIPLLGDAFVPLVEGREPEADPAPRVELLVTHKEGWDPDAVDPDGTLPSGSTLWRRAEARLLAQRLAELVRDEGVAPGTIAILARGLADLRVYERALTDRGIPAFVSAGRGYWETGDVHDVLAFLGALANPRDEDSLFAMLASPFAGVSSDTLAALALARRAVGRDAWATLGGAFCSGGDGEDTFARSIAPAEAARLRSFCTWFAAERESAPRYGIATLIERAIASREFDLAMLRLHDGRRRIANIRKLVRLARAHEERDGRDIRAFLDSVALQQELAAREGEAPLDAEGPGSAVRLMSMHSAKGLEFDVVVLADTGRRPASPGADLMVDHETGEIGLRVLTPGQDSEPALDYDTLCAGAAETQEAEELRLHYVACTRAKERLIVSGALDVDKWPDVPTAAKPAITWLGPALLPDVRNLVAPGGSGRARVGGPGPDGYDVLWAVSRPDGEPVLRPESLRPAAADVATAATAPEPALVAVSEPRRSGPPVRTISYSGLSIYAGCGYSFYAQKVLGMPREERSWAGVDTSAGLDGATRGSLAHALLERLDFAAPELPDPPAAQALGEEWGIDVPEFEAEWLRDAVAGFASTPLFARLGSARDVHREAGFYFPLGEGPGGLLVNGFIDVLGWEGDRALVVDYKSDELDTDDLEAMTERRYRVQRLIYALAMLHAGASAVEVSYCYLRRADAPVTKTFHAEDKAGLLAELESLAEGIQSWSFEPTATPHRWVCGECPVRGTLCPYPNELTMRESPGIPPGGPEAEPELEPPEEAYEDDLPALQQGELF